MALKAKKRRTPNCLKENNIVKAGNLICSKFTADYRQKSPSKGWWESVGRGEQWTRPKSRRGAAPDPANRSGHSFLPAAHTYLAPPCVFLHRRKGRKVLAYARTRSRTFKNLPNEIGRKLVHISVSLVYLLVVRSYV